MSQVLNHLLFHKAMIGIDTEKIDQYIEIAGRQGRRPTTPPP